MKFKNSVVTQNVTQNVTRDFSICPGTSLSYPRSDRDETLTILPTYFAQLLDKIFKLEVLSLLRKSNNIISMSCEICFQKSVTRDYYAPNYFINLCKTGTNNLYIT